jgi:hypothetical protein
MKKYLKLGASIYVPSTQENLTHIANGDSIQALLINYNLSGKFTGTNPVCTLNQNESSALQHFNSSRS